MNAPDRSAQPFHELTDAEFAAYQEAGLTWREVAEMHPQPAWCAYPGALAGPMGCWSLTGRMVTGEGYCKGCDCYAPNSDPQP